jgi:hypothetical protein
MLGPGTLAGANAALIVSPNANAAVEGDNNNIAPFGTTNELRYQQVFGASDFSAPGAPLIITAIAFRPDALPVPQGPGSWTVSNLRVDLSTTAMAPDGLSIFTADNIGADNTTVFSGDWTYSTVPVGPAAGPKAFDIVLRLENSFLYDPALGNLLLDTRSDATSMTPFVIMDAADNPTDTVSRLFWIGDRDSPFGSFDTIGLIAQFEVTVVPEPATWALMLAGLIVLSGAALGPTRTRTVARRGDSSY